jgi:hypothetical protein
VFVRTLLATFALGKRNGKQVEDAVVLRLQVLTLACVTCSVRTLIASQLIEQTQGWTPG